MNKIFQKKNIPNMLLVFRMILTPVIVVLLLIPTNYFGQPIYMLESIVTHGVYTKVYLNQLIAGSFFILASLTDWLDGMIARKFNWVSDFGKLWDPVADKILVNSVLICFAYWQMVPVWIPIIMIARDIAVDADRMIAATKKVVVPANIYGKLKTILQMFGIVFIFFICNESLNKMAPDEVAMYWGIQNLCMYLACLVSVFSGIIYFIQIKEALKNEKRKN